MDSTYDAKNNLAYLSLTDDDRMGRVVRSVTLLDTAVNDDIVMDFDDDGHLIGLEFLNARQSLRPEVLERARPIK